RRTPTSRSAWCRAPVTGSSASSGLTTASDEREGSSSASGGEREASDEKEDDGAETCDLSSGKDEVDVESEHDANDAVDGDHDGTPDSMESPGDDHRDTCAAANDDGEECRLSDSEKQELDDHAEAPCGSSNAGSNPAPVPGLK